MSVFLNDANPNLNTFKDSESKFKGLNVVYSGAISRYNGPGVGTKKFDVTSLYLDANYTVPLTLTKMVEMIESGVPIAACIGDVLSFATGTFIFRESLGGGKTALRIIGLTFHEPQFYSETGTVGSDQYLKYQPIVGMVDFTEEAANGNLESGMRPDDGIEQGIRGCNIGGFTIAFGMNYAAQKVLPNPFIQSDMPIMPMM